MKKIAIMGANGRMGREVMRVLESHQQMMFTAGVSKDSDEFLSRPSLLNPAEVDGVIDFSLPDGFAQILKWCVDNKKPIVSGTTGLLEDHLDLLKDASKHIPALWSPNMSLGVALLRKALGVFAQANWFDFAIEEFHHSKKIDQPSGTALHLKRALEHKIGRDVHQVSAIRGGGIYGIHSVFAMSEDEVLEFKHTALNRSVFAFGAVRSCEWLLEQKPGMYILEDVIDDRV